MVSNDIFIKSVADKSPIAKSSDDFGSVNIFRKALGATIPSNGKAKLNLKRSFVINTHGEMKMRSCTKPTKKNCEVGNNKIQEPRLANRRTNPKKQNQKWGKQKQKTGAENQRNAINRTQ
jgi:hypothetical protein